MKYFTLLLVVTLHVRCWINFSGFLPFNQPKQLVPAQNLKSIAPAKMSLPQSINDLNKQVQQVQQSLQSLSIAVNDMKNTFTNDIQIQTKKLKEQVDNFVQFSNSNFKKYSSVSQTKYRETVYNKNLKNINSQNKLKSSYSQGLTFYADYTPQQFQQLVLNPRIVNNPVAIKGFQSIFGFVVKGINSYFSALSNIFNGGRSSINFSNSNQDNRNKNNNSSNKTNTANKSNTQTTSKQKQQVKTPQKIIDNAYKFAPSSTIKSSIDWRKQNRTSPVKMQGSCGNCYAFSATGALESAVMIKHNKTKISYSDQQITDCCGTNGYGCNGCQGGWQWQAFQYIKQYGIVSQQQYPNVSLDQGVVGKCQKIMSPSKIINKQKPFIAIQQGNVSALYEAVSKQPVSVGIDATNMQFASSTDSNQLFSNCSSSFDDANHAMLIVGYDSQGNWILKNSWSRFWGNQGYIKLKAGNTCGVANFALYPQVI